MSTLSLRLPESLHRQLKDVPEREGVSIDQLITTAVAEKLSASMTADYLEGRAARGNRPAFDRVLAKAPDVPADEADRTEDHRAACRSVPSSAGGESRLS